MVIASPVYISSTITFMFSAFSANEAVNANDAVVANDALATLPKRNDAVCANDADVA